MIELRPYQVAAVNAAEATAEPCLIVMATGLGKTTVFCEIVRRALARTPGKKLILAHRHELLEQAQERIRKQIGEYPDTLDRPRARVIVDSVQRVASWISRGKPLPGFDHITLDEGHHAASASYRRVFEYYKASRWVSVTATPERNDAEELPFREVFRYDLYDGIRDGWLAPLKFKLFEVNRPSDCKLRVQMGDFVLTDLGSIIDKANEKIVEVVSRECPRKRCLAFFPTVQTAEAFAGMLSSAGFRSACVHGGTPKAERKEIIDRYQRGEIDILTNCAVLTEGFDAPETDCVIVARPTKSEGLYKQIIGRGSRLAPGKTHCDVLHFGFHSLQHFEINPKSIGAADSEVVPDPDAPPPGAKAVFKRSTGRLINEENFFAESGRVLASLNSEQFDRKFRDRSPGNFCRIMRLQKKPYTFGQFNYAEKILRGAFRNGLAADYSADVLNESKLRNRQLTTLPEAWFLWRFGLPCDVPRFFGVRWQKQIKAQDFRLLKGQADQWIEELNAYISKAKEALETPNVA